MVRTPKKREPEKTTGAFGPVVKQWLADVGITSVEELRRIGPVTAYRMVKSKQVGASINLLWNFYGATKEKDWLSLTPTEKDNLREELEALGG